MGLLPISHKFQFTSHRSPFLGLHNRAATVPPSRERPVWGRCCLEPDLARPSRFRISEIVLASPPKSVVSVRRPVPLEGRFAIVTSAGRDAVDADGASDEGAGCGRRSRVVLTPPTLVSSSWRQLHGRRWQKSPVAGESAI